MVSVPDPGDGRGWPIALEGAAIIASGRIRALAEIMTPEGSDPRRRRSIPFFSEVERGEIT